MTGKLMNIYNQNGPKTFKAKTANQRKLINEALDIINSLRIPLDNLSGRALEKMALSFLAVCQIKKAGDWKNVKDAEDGIALKSRDIIDYINRNFKENISSGSYDDIRRKDLKLLVLAEIVARSNPDAATNNPTRGYCLSLDFSSVIKAYGTKEWKSTLNTTLSQKPSLTDLLARKRQLGKIEVKLPSGVLLNFSPGAHNDLQKAIIEEFLPRFAKGAEVLYVGDTAKKYLVLETKRLEELSFFEIAHEQLPDVIAYMPDKNWIVLIEAFHSTGTISPTRHLELENLCKNCSASIIYLTAFFDKQTFRANAADISWETEVWIAEHPDHMIHFNGDKFLGPYE